MSIFQEAQGFSRTKSNSRLVYDYKSCSQESSSPQGSPRKREGLPEVVGATHKVEEKCYNSSKVRSPSGSLRFNENVNRTPEKTTKATNSTVSNNRQMSRYGFNGSPKISMKQSPGSVLSKASMFENKNNTYVKVKDPAEMTLSERKALFERNKGEALIPKAPLTMSVPTKKLMEKEKIKEKEKGISHIFRIFV